MSCVRSQYMFVTIHNATNLSTKASSVPDTPDENEVDIIAMTYRLFSRYTALLARKVPPAFQRDASRRMAAITASRPLIMLRMPGDARGATRLFHSDLEGGNKDALEPNTQTISRIQTPLDSGTHYIVKVPNLGNGITHGKIHQWHKIIGDSVEVGDLLCVIETDQVSLPPLYVAYIRRCSAKSTHKLPGS